MHLGCNGSTPELVATREEEQAVSTATAGPLRA